MSVDRLAEIKTRWERARTPRPDGKPPASESEALAYLIRLGDFLEKSVPDIDWLIAEVERLRKDAS